MNCSKNFSYPDFGTFSFAIDYYKNRLYNSNINYLGDFTMYTNYLEKLEFYKIIEMVSNFCITYKGKELASCLMPNNQVNKVEKLLQETR